MTELSSMYLKSPPSNPVRISKVPAVPWDDTTNDLGLSVDEDVDGLSDTWGLLRNCVGGGMMFCWLPLIERAG